MPATDKLPSTEPPPPPTTPQRSHGLKLNRTQRAAPTQKGYSSVSSSLIGTLCVAGKRRVHQQSTCCRAIPVRHARARTPPHHRYPYPSLSLCQQSYRPPPPAPPTPNPACLPARPPSNPRPDTSTPPPLPCVDVGWGVLKSATHTHATTDTRSQLLLLHAAQPAGYTSTNQHTARPTKQPTVDNQSKAPGVHPSHPRSRCCCCFCCSCSQIKTQQEPLSLVYAKALLLVAAAE